MLHYNNLLLQYTYISITKKKNHTKTEPNLTQNSKKKNNEKINIKILICDINHMSL